MSDESSGAFVVFTVAVTAVVYVAIFRYYVGRSLPLFALSVAVGWLFLLQTRLYIAYDAILEPGRWAIMIGVLALAAVAAIRLRRPIRVNGVILTPLIVLAYSFASALWSVNPSLTIQRSGAVTLLTLTVLSIMCYVGDAPDRLQATVKSVVLPVTVLFWGLTVVYGFDTTYYDRYGVWRTAGPMLNPNQTGAVAVLLAPSAYYAWKASERGRSVWLAALATWVGMLLLSGSRGPLLGFAVAVAFAVVVRRGVLAMLGVTFGLPAGFMVWEFSDTMQGFAAHYLRFEHIATAAGRFEAWAAATDLLMKSPALLTGYGFGTEDLLFALFELVFEIHNGAYVHNAYLGLALQLGVIVAGVVIVWLLVMAARGFGAALRHGDQLTIALEATLLAGLFVGLTESWFYSAGNAVALPFWVLVGVLLRRAGSLERAVPVGAAAGATRQAAAGAAWPGTLTPAPQ